MAESRMKFTRSNVEALPFAATTKTRVEIRDTEVPGLVLRVGTESKVFYLVRRDKGMGGKQVKVKLGMFPDLLPQDARGRALDLLKNKSGVTAAKSAEDASTIERLWALYEEIYMPGHLKESTQKVYRITYNANIEPNWGSRDPRSVSRREIREYFETYSKKSPAQANKFLTVLSSLFTFALKREVVEFNPCSLIELNPTVRRSRKLEEGNMKLACSVIDSFPPLYRHCYWLFLLLGQRRSETSLMEWKEIDFNNWVWTIPGDDILGLKKGKTKNGLTHTVPLPPLAREHILAMRQINGDQKHVFHCDGEAWNKQQAGPINPPTLTQFLDRQFKNGKMDGCPKFTIHDLRRTAFTQMTSLTNDLALVRMVVNHVDTRAASTHYDYHHYNPVKLKALTLWEERLRGLVGLPTALSKAA